MRALVQTAPWTWEEIVVGEEDLDPTSEQTPEPAETGKVTAWVEVGGVRFKGRGSTRAEALRIAKAKARAAIVDAAVRGKL